MPRLKLSLETMAELDNGFVGLMVNREILKAIGDLEDRGEEDRQPRTVTIKLAMVMSEGRAITKVAVDAKLPPLKSHSTNAKVLAEGGKHYLLFQQGDPDNPEQDTLFDKDGNKLAEGEIPTQE